MSIKRIDSANNSLYKELLHLMTSKGIQKQKKCLISGEKIVRELLLQVSNSSFFIYHSEFHTLFDLAPQKQVVVLNKDLFYELDSIGTNAPILCTDTPTVKSWAPQKTLEEHELLCALGDPNNLGAVIRSACAFGVRKVILLSECANAFLPKVTKSASGCNFLIEFEKGPSIHDLAGVSNLAALDMHGENIRTENLQKQPQRWLIGQEGQGLPPHLNCKKISIPIMPNTESLNAAISASILLYELQIPVLPPKVKS